MRIPGFAPPPPIDRGKLWSPRLLGPSRRELEARIEQLESEIHDMTWYLRQIAMRLANSDKT
jgi:hypothetical protein